MASYKIQNEIDVLVNKLSDEIHTELKTALKAMDDDNARLVHLVNITSQNRSSWSGGMTTTNMYESMRRNAAITMLDNMKYNFK